MTIVTIASRNKFEILLQKQKAKESSQILWKEDVACWLSFFQGKSSLPEGISKRTILYEFYLAENRETLMYRRRQGGGGDKIIDVPVVAADFSLAFLEKTFPDFKAQSQLVDPKPLRMAFLAYIKSNFRVACAVIDELVVIGDKGDLRGRDVDTDGSCAFVHSNEHIKAEKEFIRHISSCHTLVLLRGANPTSALMPRSPSLMSPPRHAVGFGQPTFTNNFNVFVSSSEDRNQSNVINVAAKNIVTSINDLKANIKADMADVKADVTDVKADVVTSIDDLKANIKADMADVKADVTDVKANVANVKADVAAVMNGQKKLVKSHDSLKEAVVDTIEDIMDMKEDQQDLRDNLLGNSEEILPNNGFDITMNIKGSQQGPPHHVENITDDDGSQQVPEENGSELIHDDKELDQLDPKEVAMVMVGMNKLRKWNKYRRFLNSRKPDDLFFGMSSLLRRLAHQECEDEQSLCFSILIEPKLISTIRGLLVGLVGSYTFDLLCSQLPDSKAYPDGIVATMDGEGVKWVRYEEVEDNKEGPKLQSKLECGFIFKTAFDKSPIGTLYMTGEIGSLQVLSPDGGWGKEQEFGRLHFFGLGRGKVRIEKLKGLLGMDASNGWEAWDGMLAATNFPESLQFGFSSSESRSFSNCQSVELEVTDGRIRVNFYESKPTIEFFYVVRHLSKMMIA